MLAHTHAAVYAYFSLLNIRTKLYSSESIIVEFKKTFKYFNFNETKLRRTMRQEIEKIARGENPELLDKINKKLSDER